jgi:DNA-binding MarR family transcriptional regulator
MHGTDADECYCSALRQAARQITQLYDRALADSGLRVTQYSILSRIDRNGAQPIQQLADALAMDRTTLSHNVGPLIRDRLLVSAPSAADRRVKELRVTHLGRAKLASARAGWRVAQSKFEKVVGGGRAGELRSLARAITGTLAEQPERS